MKNGGATFDRIEPQLICEREAELVKPSCMAIRTRNSAAVFLRIRIAFFIFLSSGSTHLVCGRLPDTVFVVAAACLNDFYSRDIYWIESGLTESIMINRDLDDQCT